jgi:hypothetical protein
MALLAVIIPQKEITVDFSIKDIKEAILKLPKMLDACKVIDENDIIKKYDLQFTSFMSMGNRLSLQLTEISENKTKITIDTTRMIGSFNESHEVSSANTDYNKMITALSKVLSNPNMEEDEMTRHNFTIENSNSGTNFVLVIAIIAIVMYILTR